jgi:hypothetical protein
MVKGEPLTAPAGRADDYAWPRREVGREQAKGDTPVAATTPDGSAAPGSPSPGPAAAIAPPRLAPKRPPMPPQQPAQAQPSFRDFFGFGSPQPPPPRQLAPAPGPRNPAQNPAIPRPPGNVGRSAEMIR